MIMDILQILCFAFLFGLSVIFAMHWAWSVVDILLALAVKDWQEAGRMCFHIVVSGIVAALSIYGAVAVYPEGGLPF